MLLNTNERNVFGMKKLVFIALLIAVGCSQSPTDVSGPVKVQLINVQQGHCQYQVSPVQINSLDSLREMRGRVGRSNKKEHDARKNVWRGQKQV